MDDLLSLAPMLLLMLLIVVPLFYIVARTGKSLWWAAGALVPLIGFVVVLWVLAFGNWPNLSKPASRSTSG